MTVTDAQTMSPDVVIGVAVPVPEPWGDHLRTLRVGYGEDRARHIPTHITLLPPTPLGSTTLDEVREHLATVAARHPGFEVILRGTGTFRPVSEVVFVQVAQGVASCEQLELEVRTGPLSRELQFPYHPHVTLAHDLAPQVLDRAFRDLAGFHCTFQVDAFRLYAHGGDELWVPLEDFPLTG